MSFNQFKETYDEIHNSFVAGILSLEDLNHWKEKQLRSVITHAKSSSSFYKKSLKDINSQSVSLSELESLPFTTKLDLRNSMLDILSGTVNDAIFYYETTGTTGAATPCPRDKKEAYANNKQLARGWQKVVQKHFGDHRPVVGIMGPTEVHSFGDTLGDVCYQIDCCNAKIWPHSPVIGFDKTLQLIKDLKIGVLASAPGMMLILAKEAEKQGYNPVKDFDVEALMLSGELCTDSLAKNLTNLWGATPYNSLYGSQETFIVGSTDSRNVMRPHLLNYIFELIDPNGDEALPLEGTGELCVTMLVPGAKPLIRYRTGDLVTIKRNPNAALEDQLSIFVHGRTKDQLIINGENISPKVIETALLQHVDRCLGYQVQIQSQNNIDQVSAYLEMSKYSEMDRSDVERKSTEAISKALNMNVAVKITDNLEEYANLGSWFSWKEARIVDHRNGEKSSPKLRAAQ